MPSQVREGLEVQLAVGLAAQLAAWDVVSYVADGVYPSGVVRPLYFGPDEPVNAPDERVILTPRTALEVGPSRRTVEVPVGFNWRGRPQTDAGGQHYLDGLDFLSMLRRRLPRFAGTLGGIPVSGVRHESSGSIGNDSRRRPGATATYLFRCRLVGVNA